MSKLCKLLIWLLVSNLIIANGNVQNCKTLIGAFVFLILNLAKDGFDLALPRRLELQVQKVDSEPQIFALGTQICSVDTLGGLWLMLL